MQGTSRQFKKAGTQDLRQLGERNAFNTQSVFHKVKRTGNQTTSHADAQAGLEDLRVRRSKQSVYE